jgi:ATP-dependent protease ClpP protease subunit
VERIKIHGHIGPSYVDEAGVLQQGVELADIITAVHGIQSPILQFEIKSPGGYVEFGNQIYDYLMSLKKEGKTIEMYQVGLIGSIATKIFMAGDVREVDPSHEFFIHNPWMVPDSGDADKLREQADSLEATEKALRKFYAEHTKITDEGLDALMKNETSLTAEQAVKLGFATRIKSVAFALVTKKKMAEKKEDKTLKDQLLALLGVDKKKGVQPKAQKPGSDAKSLVVTLADNAGQLWVEGEELVVGAGAFLLDENGEPTMDAVAPEQYMAEDGTLFEVGEDGKIASVTPAEQAKKDKDELAELVKSEVEKALKAQAEASAEAIAKVKEEAEAASEAKIMALKKDLKLGIQPKKALFKNPDGSEKTYKSIGQVMAEKAEQRKKQLNGIR